MAKKKRDRSGDNDQDLEWIDSARSLLDLMATAKSGIEATLGRHEISDADSPAIDFLIERVEGGLAWLEQTHAPVHAEASTELRAALGVMRNLAFAVRRLTTGEDNEALRRSCDALIEQGQVHIQDAVGAVDRTAKHLA